MPTNMNMLVDDYSIKQEWPLEKAPSAAVCSRLSDRKDCSLGTDEGDTFSTRQCTTMFLQPDDTYLSSLS